MPPATNPSPRPALLRTPHLKATTIFPARPPPPSSRLPAAHPSALVTVPRAPSRAGWGEGVTLITLGREQSGGKRAEPLTAPPSPLFRREGSERDLPRPSPPPPPPPPPHTPTARAPVAARATERLEPARVRLAPSARAPLPPLRARARAPSPHSSGFKAGEVGLPSAPPNQRSRRCHPFPSPCALARVPGLRAARQPGRGLRQAPQRPRAPPGRVGACGRRGWHSGPLIYLGALRWPRAAHDSSTLRVSSSNPGGTWPGRGLSDRPAKPCSGPRPGLHLRLQPGLPIHWAPALSPLGSARGQENHPPTAGLTWGLGLGSSRPQAPRRRGRR